MDYKESYKQFLESVRDAVLSEELPIKAIGLEDDFYFAEVDIDICGCKCKFTVADSLICCHNEITKGMFQGEYFEAFKSLIRRKTKVYTPEEKARLKELRDEIQKIKGE